MPYLPEIISDAGLLSGDKNNNTKALLTAL